METWLKKSLGDHDMYALTWCIIVTNFNYHNGSFNTSQYTDQCRHWVLQLGDLKTYVSQLVFRCSVFVNMRSNSLWFPMAMSGPSWCWSCPHAHWTERHRKRWQNNHQLVSANSKKSKRKTTVGRMVQRSSFRVADYSIACIPNKKSTAHQNINIASLYFTRLISYQDLQHWDPDTND